MAQQVQDQEQTFQPTVTLTDVGPAKKKIAIEISAEAIAAKLAENFDSLQSEAQLPGFRRGFAPMKLLQKRFGGDVRKEVCSQLVGESYTHAVQTHELRVLGEPDIKNYDDLKLPDSGPLSFEVEIEVAPDVELPDLKGIEVKKPAIEVTDEQIDSEVERYCEMYGQPAGVDEVEAGDYVSAQVKITDAADGASLHEADDVPMLVTGEDREFKGVVSGILIRDLGKELAGKKKGDIVKLEADGPASHEVEALRGKKLNIELTVRKVERLEPLPVDELVTMVGMESETELREQIKQQLSGKADQTQRQAMAAQVVKTLLEKVTLELPEGLSNRQAEQILHRRQYEMMMRGAKPQDIEEKLAELRAASQETAQKELKSLFILDAVAQKLEVEVTDNEVNGRVVQIAMQQGRRPQSLRDEMARNGQLQQLYVQMREEKAIEKIIADAKVQEISEEEWRKMEGLEAPAAKPRKKKSAPKKAKAEKAEDASPAADDAEAKAPRKKSTKKKSDE
ncbi:MAG: trigger factor [Planctomycetes bacterium]|nr:trigger factor [Planctomycetota bacterium]